MYVEPDLSPGIKSFGGKGWVRDMDCSGRDLFYEIQYLETEATKVERNIPLGQVVLHIPPQQLAQLVDYQINTHSKPKTIPPKKPQKTKKDKVSKETKFVSLWDKLIHSYQCRKNPGVWEDVLSHCEYL